MAQHTQINQCIHHINRMKKQVHAITSIEAENVFDKIQHAVMIKKNS